MEEVKMASPFSNEHLYVITELAKYGLEWIRQALPEAEAILADEIKSASPEKAEELKLRLEHLRSLGGLPGRDAYAHFNNMCQYLYEAELAAAKKNGGKGEAANG